MSKLSLSVVPKEPPATGPADVRDRRWLDEQVVVLGHGLEAAKVIWTNWFDGRQVGRLHPGMTAGQYIASLGMRLTLPEAMEAMPAASTRELATVAGVGKSTVHRERPVPSGTPVRGSDGKTYPVRVVRTVTAEIIEEAPTVPTDVAPIERRDTALALTRRGELAEAIRAVRALSAPRSEYAEAVFKQQRGTTAKRLRELGVVLGGIAVELERMKEVTE